MAGAVRYPSLLQINTRVWLNRLSREAGTRVTLADIDDATVDGFAEQGFDWVWLLSVWQIGAAGRAALLALRARLSAEVAVTDRFCAPPAVMRASRHPIFIGGRFHR